MWALCSACSLSQFESWNLVVVRISLSNRYVLLGLKFLNSFYLRCLLSVVYSCRLGQMLLLRSTYIYGQRLLIMKHSMKVTFLVSTFHIILSSSESFAINLLTVVGTSSSWMLQNVFKRSRPTNTALCAGCLFSWVNRRGSGWSDVVVWLWKVHPGPM